MMTQEFAFNVGINSDYREVADAVSRLVRVWRDAADVTWGKSGIYVAAVVQESRTVYRTEWGCPSSGEATLTVSGIRNPEFHKDELEWRSAVRSVCAGVKLSLCQSTAYLSFRDVDLEYMK